ncbi:hypothetical protein BJG94_01630 [Rhizobium sp. Td3]|nr:hypothetical protein BJG94_01630 [Rhizobium sp. Td3]
MNMTGQGRVKLLHHQLAMFLDTMFMAKIVSATKGRWQAKIPLSLHGMHDREREAAEPYPPPMRSSRT